MKPKKGLGQNFLKDPQVISDLIAAADIRDTDIVLEVGAGTGAVTQKLAEKAKQVVAVEFDCDLIPELTAKLASFKNVSVLTANILDLDLKKLPVASCQLPVKKVVGAIPYQITSPLFHKIIFEYPPINKMAFIIQKEVAEKITAQPPEGNYWSNFVQNYAEVKMGPTIKPEAFSPSPSVNSAIISFAFKRTAGAKIPPPKWSHFLHRGFAHPRQMLNKAFPQEVLNKAGIDPNLRPQNLTLQDWRRVFDIQTEIPSTKSQ